MGMRRLLGRVLDKVVPSMRMKDKMRGHARVVACDSYHGHGVYQTCAMELVVQADGLPATPREHTEFVHHDKWPTPGMTVPVTIDRADHSKMYVEWGEVPDVRERAQAQAGALAEAMRGPSGPGAVPPGAIARQGLAIEPSLLQGQPPAAPPQEAVADADQEIDEHLARLAKLGQLRDSGVLTPAEFEQQKRRILDS